MWRVIIRWSFNSDTGSAMRNNLRDLLAECGITNSSTTGTWECHATSAVEAAQRMAEMLRRLTTPSIVDTVSKEFTLDHLWVYIDRG